MLFRMFSCVIVLLFLSMPCLTLAQEKNDVAKAIADAKRDAKYAPNSYLWYPAGCFLGVAGILIAAVYTPHPPAEKLLGKSSEYIAYYTSTYQQVAKNHHVTEATLGCLTGTCLVGATYIWLLSQNPDFFYTY